MFLRVLFFVVMGLGLLGFGAVAMIASRPPPVEVAAVNAPSPNVTVIVAARVIHAGNLLRPEDVTGKDVPRPEVGPDSIVRYAGEPPRPDGRDGPPWLRCRRTGPAD